MEIPTNRPQPREAMPSSESPQRHNSAQRAQLLPSPGLAPLCSVQPEPAGWGVNRRGGRLR